jgi:predicted component of type VI protein secretion system
LFGGLVDGQIGGKVAQSAPGLRRGHANLLLGGCHNAGAFLFECSLDARLVLGALRSTSARNFAISSPSLASLASTALSRELASSVTLRADSISPSRTLAARLRRNLGRSGKRNADGQNNDGEVDELVKVRARFQGDR